MSFCNCFEFTSATLQFKLKSGVEHITQICFDIKNPVTDQ